MKKDIFEKDGTYKKGYKEEEEDEVILDVNITRILTECSNCTDEQTRLLQGTSVKPANSTTKNITQSTVITLNNTTNTSKNSNVTVNKTVVSNSNNKNATNVNENSGDVIVRHPSEIIYFSLNEILLFASVISATDAVAALAFVNEQNDPKLFPILFGEGVVNDAVCIVLYQIIKGFLDSGAGKKNQIFL